MIISQQEIDNRFGYHRGTDETMPKHVAIRNAYIDLAATISELLPAGRAASVALTQLEDSAMWANKAIAELAPLVKEGLQ